MNTEYNFMNNEQGDSVYDIIMIMFPLFKLTKKCPSLLFIIIAEVEKDSSLMWCPSPGCETVCHIQDGSSLLTGGFAPESDRAHGTAAGGSRSLPFINCPTCRKAHCAECKLSWHPELSCGKFSNLIHFDIFFKASNPILKFLFIL